MFFTEMEGETHHSALLSHFSGCILKPGGTVIPEYLPWLLPRVKVVEGVSKPRCR